MDSRMRRLHVRESDVTPDVRRMLKLMRRLELKPKDIVELLPAEVIQRLNTEPQSPAAKRVSRFIQLFNRARELNASFRLFFETREEMRELLRNRHPKVAQHVSPKDHFSSGWKFGSPEMQALNEKLNQTLAELNRMVRRYKWHPFIRHMGYELINFDVTETWNKRDAEQGWETHAIWWLCGQNGKWIDNFRRCGECGKWFFALVDHQSYCSDGCRKRHASRSEEFKEKRRLYMRKYRGNERERDNAAKAAVKKVRSASVSFKGRS